MLDLKVIKERAEKALSHKISMFPNEVILIERDIPALLAHIDKLTNKIAILECRYYKEGVCLGGSCITTNKCCFKCELKSSCPPSMVCDGPKHKEATDHETTT